MRKSLSVVMTVLAVLLVASIFVSCNQEPKVVNFTITFNPGAAEGEAFTQTVASGKDAQLEANTFSKEGYVFAGWSTTESGAVVYADRATVNVTSDLNLYAVWSMIYSITVEEVEGGSAVPSISEYTISDSIQVITLAVTPDDTHYLGNIRLTESANKEAFRLFRTVVIPMNSVGDIVITPEFNLKPVYIDYKQATWNESTKTVDITDEHVESADYTVLGDEMTTWDEKWYVVADDLMIKDRITVKGTEVNLILTDGHSLKAEQGITVPKGTKLTIYAQSLDLSAGTLIINKVGNKNAGIGGTGETDCGTVEIKGGMLQITSSFNAAALGGGQGKQAGTINIYGGLVFATGGESGAGIGGGNESSAVTVNIYGGSVNAQGGKYGAGIGGGNKASGGTIKVYGGTIVSTGGANGAGIGGGKNGTGGTLTFENGNVTAKGGNEAAGIGGGRFAKGETILINGGTIKAYGKGGGAGIGGGIESNSGSISISGGTITAIGYQDEKEYCAGAGIGGGSYSGGSGGDCETVTITGGNITATGGSGSAGIGGGDIGSGGTISISGDDTVVTAKGGDFGAGIGGGESNHPVAITISGGRVTATAGSGAAGIGGGSEGGGGTVTIRGASTAVYAAYGAHGAKYAIGPGNHVDEMGNLNLESGATMKVSYDGTVWSIYDGSTRKPYMKTPSY